MPNPISSSIEGVTAGYSIIVAGSGNTINTIGKTKGNKRRLCHQDCLRSLAFPQIESRSHDIVVAVPGTCEWLLRHDTYKRWATCDRGLPWIKGKPGSGRSILRRTGPPPLIQVRVVQCEELWVVAHDLISDCAWCVS